MSKRLYICEKPSQAEALAKVLGGARKAQGYWETNGGRVVGMAGHMLRSLKPDEMRPDAWSSPWKWEALPILPDRLKYVPEQSRASRLTEIGHLVKEAEEVVIATDGGMEGEMIGREVLDHFRFMGPVKRLWLSAMTETSVRKAISEMRDGKDTIRYHYAALALHEADWLVGMNGSRALTLKSPRSMGTVSTGRVQTPTVAIVVRRDREIQNFKARDYYEILAQVQTGVGSKLVLKHAPGEADRIFDRAVADKLAASAGAYRGPIKVLSEPGKRQRPPAPYDLTTLQRDAGRKWKWKPKYTLGIAQALYEHHKVITYPRTDCKFLTDDAKAEVPALSRALVALPELSHLKGASFLGMAWFSTKKVEKHDHDAMRPTENIPNMQELSDHEKKLYLLVATRYLVSVMPDYVWDSVTASIFVGPAAFKVTGNTPVSAGWKAAYGRGEGSDESEEEGVKLPALKDGEPVQVVKSEVAAKKTRAPERYTLDALLGDMENVGKFVTDPKLKAILNSEEDKRRGIGTPATRGDIIDGILDDGYLVEVGKAGEVQATPKAHGLITLLEKSLPSLADPAETALWQLELDKIKEGGSPDSFLRTMRETWRKNISILAGLDERSIAAGMGVSVKGTGVMIPGYEGGAQVELIDHGDCYMAQGWPGKFFAEIGGRRMVPADYKRLIEAKGEVIGPFEGFVSKKHPGVKYARMLALDTTKTPYPELTFHPTPEQAERTASTEAAVAAAKPTGVKCKYGEILDAGDRWRFSKDAQASVFKKYFGREVSPNELVAVIEAGREGVELTELTSQRTGNKFSALTKLVTKPYFKLVAIFDTPKQSQTMNSRPRTRLSA